MTSEIPIAPHMLRSEDILGPDSNVSFEEATVVKEYEPYVDNHQLVWGYAAFMTKAAAMGVILRDEVRLLPSRKMWTIEFRCVPVTSKWLEQTDGGLMPVTRSPRLVGPTMLHFNLFSYEMEKIFREMREFGCEEAEIQRLQVIHRVAALDSEMFKPVERMKSDVIARLRHKHNVYNLSILPGNERIRSEAPNFMTYWITDFGMSIGDLVYGSLR